MRPNSELHWNSGYWPTQGEGNCQKCRKMVQAGDGVYIGDNAPSDNPTPYRGRWCIECYMNDGHTISGITRCV